VFNQGAAPVTIALGEALLWADALDNHLERAEGAAAYFDRRAGHPAGRAVGGLVYARNFQAHELVGAASASFEAKTPLITHEAGKLTVSGLGFSIRLMWRDGADLPPRAERWERDAMYEERVAGRPLSHPIDEAIDWFDSALGGDGE
jgi:hypothetical protein